MVPIHDRPLTQFAKMRRRRYVEQQRVIECAHYERMERAMRQPGTWEVVRKDDAPPGAIIEFPPRKH